MEKTPDILNRELSWLAFNHSVLQEAADPNVPLIERIRFLGIFSNNLDEFFKVRVASVRRLIELKVDNTKLTGGDPKKLLNQIQKTVIRLQKIFDETYERLIKELKSEGIHIINEHDLNPRQSEFIDEFFVDKLLPVLAPIILSDSRPFPRLRDKSIYLAVKLTNPKENKYGLIELPRKTLPRFIELPKEGDNRYIILLEDVIRVKLKDIFRILPFNGFKAYTIKITRDAELDIDNDLTKSFLEKISKGVKGRKKGQPVRFVYDKRLPRDLLLYLKKRLKIDDEDSMIPGGIYHNFKDFMEFPNISHKRLEYQKLKPIQHPAFAQETRIINNILKEDILLYYPYHNFSHFISLLREAAIDPEVTSIQITLYRVAMFSMVMNSLINACLNGKKVTVVIELQARFDEESNIYWSKKLEEAGAKVLFGIPGLKVHAKILLIGKKNSKNKTEYISCVSTGNFHEGTAKVYSDVTLFTANKSICKEVKAVFNFIEFPFKPVYFRHLIFSPNQMRNKLYSLIENEVRNVKEGKKGYFYLKINNLVDQKLIRKIYAASQAGVDVTLIVRGICSLKPGIPGLSENITAISVVGRFLEHSRIFIFGNDGNELYYISSADWMPRNLDHRVEIASPVYDPILQNELKNLIMLQLKDNVKARIINEVQDNEYRKIGSKPVNSQIELYHLLKNNKLRTT